MSLFVDKMYVNLLSSRLDRFHQKSDYLWNFRCPFCNDSQKSKFKARGYIYRKGHELRFTCHNCGAGSGFSKFLRAMDRNLYSEYELEIFKESGNYNKKTDTDKALEDELRNSKPTFSKTRKIDLPTIESLPYNHFGKRYLIDRRIPKNRLTDFYWAQDFKLFVGEILPDYEKLSSMHDNECRIVIPFYSEDGKTLLGFQGRSMDPRSKAKYITLKVTNDNVKLYGLERLNRKKRVYVVEGPLDSVFLDNGVATMDSTLYSIIPVLGNLDYVFVFDNQPRNKDVVRTMQKTIKMGHNICIWPKGIPEKDINDMIMAGTTSAQVQDMIDRNTFNDLEAQLHFDNWRKV